MTATIERLVAELELQILSETASARPDGFAQDIREAVDYWCALGRSAIQHDTKVDYPSLVSGQRKWLARLENALTERPREDQILYRTTMERSAELLEEIAKVELPEEGYLRVIAIILDCFKFLHSERAFSTKTLGPNGVLFSSNEVYVRLEIAPKSYSSCRFGSERQVEREFYVDDLLFLYQDERITAIPENLALDSESKIEEWFGFLANVFKSLGGEMLSNAPGIFDRLFEAQLRKDEEYALAMQEAQSKSL